jgi:hypothetical protein
MIYIGLIINMRKIFAILSALIVGGISLVSLSGSQSAQAGFGLN